MKSAIYHEYGNPSVVVKIVEMERKEIELNQIRISLELTAINPADLFSIMGSYPLKSPFPRVPGSEGIGKIIEIGTDVTGLQVGNRVLIPILADTSVWSEEIIVDANKIFVVPENVVADPKQIAMASVNPPSAYGMLTQFVNLKKGDWVIQNAANSAVGSCVIGFAKKMGLKTVNIVRREEVLDSVKALGGNIVLVDGTDLAKRLKKEYGRLNIKLGLDGVSGEATHQISQCLTDRATLVNYGAMSMKKCELGVSQLIFKQIKLLGYWYSRWTQEAKKADVLKLNEITNKAVFDGDIQVHINDVVPLEEIQRVLKQALTPKANGKTLISGPSYAG